MYTPCPPITKKVLLGSWERGQEYTNDIIENLNHFSTGWTDWNLVLDMNGGVYTHLKDDNEETFRSELGE